MPSSLDMPTPLVSTAWLADHLRDPRLRVLDASMYLPTAGRDARAEYAAAHIPGAVFADLAWLSDPEAPFPHTLPAATLFSERIGQLGVGSDDAAVVYDGSGQLFSAPRLWWMLRSFGHRQVAVLDGTLTKWVADGYAVTDAVSAPTPAVFHATLDASRWRDIEAMRRNVTEQQAQVLDARSPGRFSGAEAEPRAGVRGGHMPHSINVHYATLSHSDGTLRSPEQLRALFDDRGVALDQPIVASCGTGVTACAIMLALDTLGVDEKAVFDGSWTEWGSAVDTPVERSA
ncbi:MAG: 3-mercaptopyruvate sulfurtransferase [Gemmatimonadaceae bacterium]|nr:3-mercaptopyruvate sulfurtransferase [Gemmatimonadaceae bacterium]